MQSRIARIATLSLVLLTGVGIGAWAGKKNPVSAADYQGKDPKAAAAALLEIARLQAGDGSWENLAVARVLYLGGDKAAGKEIIDRVLAGKKAAAGDYVRAARIYAEAGEWELARPLFDRVVEMKGDDEDWLAEVGAQYLVHGDRARAEELFGRSFVQDPEALYNTLRVAGAYLGIAPRE